MKSLFQTMSILGQVSKVEPRTGRFSLRLLSGDEIPVCASPTTYYQVLMNLSDADRNRVPPPSREAIKAAFGEDHAPSWLIDVLRYLQNERLVSVSGVLVQNGELQRFDARRVVLLHSEVGRYGFEDTHWWLQQINSLFEEWLDKLFGDKREFTVNDFAGGYRTSLDLLGNKTDNVVQECATMSRFLYGLSSSYLLTGNERALSAARACAEYLMNGFAVVTHDRRYCFWKSARVRENGSTRDVMPSQNWDDRQSYALYEQIYALSGLTQYYRITQDTRILGFLKMTIAAFQDFFHDTKRDGDPAFKGNGGYFSHIDTVTMRPDSPVLNLGDGYDNVCKKNWNSIGDHIPAYLVNLLLAIDPLPKSREGEWQQLRVLCRHILDDCVKNILDHFFTSDSDMVNERFNADWTQDLDWGWQQNRGIVGHNFKISWNLVRCGHYYRQRVEQLKSEGSELDANAYEQLARRCYDQASALALKMDAIGVDQWRGGIWDALERKKKDGIHEFSWGNTKDFWQQEQAILACYILYGVPGQPQKRADRFLELARSCAFFWNQFFLDRDHRKVFFRTDDSGMPVIEGQYGSQAGHAIAGYHAFELNYLAHLYIRSYVVNNDDADFALVFRPADTQAVTTLNVLPDFMPPDTVRINTIRVNGVEQKHAAVDSFQLDISSYPSGSRIEVEFRPVKAAANDFDKTRPTTLGLFR